MSVALVMNVHDGVILAADSASTLVLGTTERHWWQLTRPDVIEFFMHHAPGIDLHIVDPEN